MVLHSEVSEGYSEGDIEDMRTVGLSEEEIEEITGGIVVSMDLNLLLRSEIRSVNIFYS